MEFPNLGDHCSDSRCKQLDFLPMKCDACTKLFCKDHINYASHNCDAAYKKDVQVPVCPLCNKPVPVNKGELPDIKVGQHIDLDCQSDPAKEKRKAYANKCSLKGCKQKELVKVTCDSCQLNYCIKHRHPQDHECQGFQQSGQGISRAGAAAVNRLDKLQNRGKPSKQKADSSSSGGVTAGSVSVSDGRVATGSAVAVGGAQTIQGGLSEDEALARVLQMSLVEQQQQQPTSTPASTTRNQQQEDDDRALAQAIAASEQDQATRQPQKQKSCTVH